VKYYDLNLKGTSYEEDKSLILEAYRLSWNYVNLLYPPEIYEEAIKYKNDLISEIYDIISENPLNNTKSDIVSENPLNNTKSNALNKTPKNKLEIEFGIEIQAKNQNESYKISRKYRNKTKFISVLGGDLGINRAVCENRLIDVLSRPYLNKRSCGINQVLAKEAYKNDIAIELTFNDILSSYLSYRSKIMAHFSEIIKLHKKFKFPLIITTGSSSIWDIHSPRDISAVFKSLGLSEEEVNTCLFNYPNKIVEFNKERENMVVLGVKKIDKGMNKSIVNDIVNGSGKNMEDKNET